MEERTVISGNEKNKKVMIKCFGGFEVYLDGRPMQFTRTKGKELLAFLVDKKGTGVTNEQIAEALFEEKEYDRGTKGSIQKIISTLRKDLRKAGVEDILYHNWNSLSINPDKVECDYFEYIDGNEKVLLKYWLFQLCGG